MVPGAEARGLVAPRRAGNRGCQSLHKHRDRSRLTAASLDGITALPDHGDDGAAVHVYWSSQHRSGSTRGGCRTLDEASEEGLVLEVGICTRVSIFGRSVSKDMDRTVGLEVLLAGGGELDGSKLVPTLLEAGDDGANESALDTVGLDGNEAVLASVGQFLSWRADEGSRQGGRELEIKGWRGNRGAEGEGTGSSYVCSVDILTSFLVVGGGDEGDC